MPLLYAIIASVLIPTFPLNLRFATVAVLLPVPPTTDKLSVIEKFGNIRSYKTVSALKLDDNVVTTFDC